MERLYREPKAIHNALDDLYTSGKITEQQHTTYCSLIQGIPDGVLHVKEQEGVCVLSYRFGKLEIRLA